MLHKYRLNCTERSMILGKLCVSKKSTFDEQKLYYACERLLLSKGLIVTDTRLKN